ncbi:hypothetical protein GEMRC1_012849 [Eukaryota sp. GEM-RC1]
MELIQLIIIKLPLSSLKNGLKYFVSISQSIGLEIKLPKCFLIGKRFAELMYGEQSIQFVDYITEAVRFLGSYFGDPLQIESVLKNYLQKIKVQLQTIQDLKIDNHLAFPVLSVCFGSKINHLLRSLPPELSLGFAREFNSLRT